MCVVLRAAAFICFSGRIEHDILISNHVFRNRAALVWLPENILFDIFHQIYQNSDLNLLQTGTTSFFSFLPILKRFIHFLYLQRTDKYILIDIAEHRLVLSLLLAVLGNLSYDNDMCIVHFSFNILMLLML